MEELKTKLNAEKVELENQWNQLLEIAKNKKDEIDKANVEYENAVQEIRDNQNTLRGRYAEIDNILSMISETETTDTETFEIGEVVTEDDTTKKSKK